MGRSRSNLVAAILAFSSSLNLSYQMRQSIVDLFMIESQIQKSSDEMGGDRTIGGVWVGIGEYQKIILPPTTLLFKTFAA